MKNKGVIEIPRIKGKTLKKGESVVEMSMTEVKVTLSQEHLDRIMDNAMHTLVTGLYGDGLNDLDISKEENKEKVRNAYIVLAATERVDQALMERCKELEQSNKILRRANDKLEKEKQSLIYEHISPMVELLARLSQKITQYFICFRCIPRWARWMHGIKLDEHEKELIEKPATELKEFQKLMDKIDEEKVNHIIPFN